MSAARGLALSTMYAQRFDGAPTLEPFFEAGRRLGFERFELSHILEPGVVEAVDPSEHHIAAVHHPCPRRAGDERGLSLGAERPEDRRYAADRLIESIVTASRLRAPALVLHLGGLEGSVAERCRRLEFELDARVRAGQTKRAAFADASGRMRGLLEEAEPPVLQRALESLSVAAPRAAELGIRLGMETGYGARELPTADGMRWLLARLAERGFSDTVGAWLDSGHVAARSVIGLDGFEAYFDAVADRWVGAHLHDCVGRRDHLAPGDGSIDFGEIARRLPSGIVHTCELDWYLEDEEILRGRDRLLEAGFGL